MKPHLMIVALVASLWVSPGHARTWSVPTEIATLAAALDSSAAGDTVLVDPGIYMEHSLSMKSGVVMKASGAPGSTVIDAAQLGRVIDCDSTLAGTRFDGIRFTGGHLTAGFPDGIGAGVRCQNSVVEFVSCAFDSNTARRGGGLGSINTDLDLDTCTFTDNVAEGPNWGAGGGIYVLDSTGSMDDCMFTGNRAFATSDTLGDGGGVFSETSPITYTDCHFENNSTAIGGGGFYSFNLDFSTLVRCTFLLNTGAAGGAIYCEESRSAAVDCDFTMNTADNGGAALVGRNSSSTFTDCRFVQNDAVTFSGGAIAIFESSPDFIRCEIVDGSATVYGGGIFGAGVCEILVEECVIARNSANLGGAIRISDLADLELTRSTIVDNVANFGSGVSLNAFAKLTTLETVIARGMGDAFHCSGTFEIVANCTNVHGNTGGDWTACVDSLAMVNGNLSSPPRFCDPASGNYRLRLPDSACLPQNNPCGVYLGAFTEGCGCPSGTSRLVPEDHLTIQAAIDASNPGDVVGVCDGVYPESITLASGVSVRGVRSDFVQVVGSVGKAVVTAVDILDTTDVSGLTIDAANLATFGVSAESLSTGLRLFNNTITGALDCGVLNGPDSQVTIGGTFGSGNDLSGNATCGVRNLNTASDSLSAQYNYWGSDLEAIVLASIEGNVRPCPFVVASGDSKACVGDPTHVELLGDSIRLVALPSPFRAHTRIAFSAASETHAKVEVFDVAGRRIRSLFDGRVGGVSRLTWDGRNEHGREVGAGVYFVRMENEGHVETTKVTYLR